MGCDIMDFDSIRVILETIEQKIATLKNAIFITRLLHKRDI